MPAGSTSLKAAKERATALGLSYPQYKKWKYDKDVVIASMRQTVATKAYNYGQIRDALMAIVETTEQFRKPGFDHKALIALIKENLKNVRPSPRPVKPRSPRVLQAKRLQRVGHSKASQEAPAHEDVERRQERSVAFAAGWTHSWLSNYAESTGVPRSTLTEGVGQLLLRSTRG